MHGRVSKGIVFILSVLIVSFTNGKEVNDEFNNFCLKFNCACPSINQTRHETLDCSTQYIPEIPLRFHIPDYITNVRFSSNNIKELKDGDFEFALGVKELDLSHNKIHFIGTNAFIPFEKLHDLILSHNKLSNIEHSSLNGLDTLQYLDLGYNNLSLIVPNVFARVPDLKKISLTFNPLKTLDNDMFTFLPNIEHIDLDYTYLKVLPENIFTVNKHLKILNLLGNRLQTIPYKVLQSTKSLISLDLSENPIHIINSHAFPHLPNLNILLLNNLRDLFEIKEHAFAELPNLNILHCSYNMKLKFIDKNAFKNNTNNLVVHLKVIYLQQNRLESVDAGLIEWNSPFYIDLSGNSWNCDCNLKWMSHLEAKHEMLDKLRCLQPRNLEGQSILSLDEDAFVCDVFVRKWIFYMLCIFLFLTTTLIIGVLLITLLKYGCLNSCKKKEQYQYKPVVNKSATVIIDNEIMDNNL